jgi:hypothetical protein
MLGCMKLSELASVMLFEERLDDLRFEYCLLPLLPKHSSVFGSAQESIITLG